ncbi:MarR family transcriptional regulator [Pseudolysinimonas sp.]|uniref:MarR family winged helix-turn-helix transcriptional regulator n=1 Tax=Pseudolysinimonas sp. TaxID=2680009 RepID=UPI00286C4036|nr:MarR family transcriptional regulator [Pseudolysinimonas sp.]
MSTVSEVPNADWDLWHTMRAMNEQLSRELDRQLQRDAGISQADYGILVTLFEAPERRMRTGELGDLLAWEKSRVSHQVARMEARGLVKRVVCESDGRGTWVTLAAEGKRALLGAMRENATAIRDLFFDELDEGEKQTMLRATSRVLAKLNAACEAEAANASAGAA